HLQRLRTGAKRGQSQTSRWTTRGRILIPPPKARGNGPRLCAEHQPQRHGEATRFGIIQRLCASALAAAGPSDTAAVRWWFQDAPRIPMPRQRLLRPGPSCRNDLRFETNAGRMRSVTEYLWFELPERRGFLNITGAVEALVRKSGVKEGLCLVNAMHITASVFINDAEDGLLRDYETWLEKLAPHEPVGQYHHNRTGEDNADEHLKRQVLG